MTPEEYRDTVDALVAECGNSNGAINQFIVLCDNATTGLYQHDVQLAIKLDNVIYALLELVAFTKQYPVVDTQQQSNARAPEQAQ
jgi:hypothetical protein